MKTAKMPITIKRNGILGVPIGLANGDRMRQPEFHRLYEKCPEDVKFELVGGIVYLASPVSVPHSNYDGELGFAFGLYRRHIMGVEVLHGATAILGEESEPQPDLGLRILPEFGGQSQTSAKKYVLGPPELLAEIAHSTRRLTCTPNGSTIAKPEWRSISFCVSRNRSCTGLISGAGARSGPRRRRLPVASLSRIVDCWPGAFGPRFTAR